MNVKQYLESKKEIQQRTIRFFSEEKIDGENFTIIEKYYTDPGYENYWDNFNEKMNLILTILNNLKPTDFLYDKIEQLFLSIQNKICNKFPDESIFPLFYSNRLILLILIKNNLYPVQSLFNIVRNNKEYGILQYLFPELKDYIDPKMIKNVKGKIFYNTKLKMDDPNDIEIFIEQRKKGTNTNLICQFIQKDSVDEFIQYINQKNVPLTSQITPSIFESNPFLMNNKNTTLIEYSAFYGAIQIFQYLKLNEVSMNSSLWLYAIHGRNAEIINILEENQVEIPSNFTEELLKLHDFDITNYFINNGIIKITDEDLNKSICFCNYSYYPHCLNSPNALYYYNKFKCSKFIKMLEDEGTIFSTDIDPKMKELDEVIIPYSINLINDKTFYLASLKKIKLPSSLEKIGKCSFSKCFSLETIIIPSSVTSIGQGCFSYCKSLKVVIFESPCKIKSIECSTFKDCFELNQISIPPLCTKIDSFAFQNCTELTGIIIPSNVLEINNYCFNCCNHLSIVKFEMPTSLMEIKEGAFRDCYSLQQMSIPYSVTSIHEWAFDGCLSLDIRIPNSLINIGNNAFLRCKSCSRY